MKPSDIGVQIASPCDQRWDTMTGASNVRHCDRCSKSVYNLSAMTLAEIDEMVSRTGNDFCRKYFLRSDGTIVVDDCPVGLRHARTRAAKIIFAFVSLFGAVFAIKEPHKRAYGVAAGVERTRFGKARVVRSLVDAYRLEIHAALPDSRSARRFPSIGMEPLVQDQAGIARRDEKPSGAMTVVPAWPYTSVGTLACDREFDPHTSYGRGITIDVEEEPATKATMGMVW